MELIIHGKQGSLCVCFALKQTSMVFLFTIFDVLCQFYPITRGLHDVTSLIINLK